MKVVATAQPMGFGPSSNLCSLLRQLGWDDVTYFGFGTAYEYFTKSQLHPVAIDGTDEFTSTYRFLTSQPIDLLITVMGSKAAILAKKLGIRVIYIDLVFWMWEFRASDYEIAQWRDQFASWTVQDVAAEVFFKEGHDQQKRMETSLLAHLVCDESYVEQFIPTEGENLRWYEQLSHGLLVAPLLDRAVVKEETEREKRPFFSLGGLQLYNRYAGVMSEAVSRFDDYIVIGSAHHLPTLTVETLPIADYLAAVQRHERVYAQPGFSTLYEMFSLDVVPIILPAQNDGQLKFVRFLQRYLAAEQFISWEQFYDEAHRTEAEFMSEVTERLATDGTLGERIYEAMVSRTVRTEWLSKQRQFVTEMMKRYPCLVERCKPARNR